jgi:hypothetical protein
MHSWTTRETKCVKRSTRPLERRLISFACSVGVVILVINFRNESQALQSDLDFWGIGYWAVELIVTSNSLPFGTRFIAIHPGG